ncbi:MAG: tetraacyldisaccharide 4'-kinase [Candidatus Omnitrophota bacterium]
MRHRIKSKLINSYVGFVEKRNLNLLDYPMHFILLFFSYAYNLLVCARNFLFRFQILRSFSCEKPVVSIGNISWGGTGKTTLSMFLASRLSFWYKVAILRRGWGADEEKLIKNRGLNVFSSSNRLRFARAQALNFDLFILDDGFQHRKLKRNVDIVVMNSREFRQPFHLIPAGIFREKTNSLLRAQILVITYKNEAENLKDAVSILISRFPHLQVFYATYKIKKFAAYDGKNFSLDDLKDRKIAACSGIGYPGGFYKLLQDSKINLSETITFPDHQDVTLAELKSLEKFLLAKGIKYLIITEKDRYHLQVPREFNVTVIVAEIEIVIQDEPNFLETVKSFL